MKLIMLLIVLLALVLVLPVSAVTIGDGTVGGLPAAAGEANNVTLIFDGANITDCTVGGGAVWVTCRSNGSAWVVPYSPLVGHTGITILGTIATGVWSGTAVVDAKVDDDITITSVVSQAGDWPAGLTAVELGYVADVTGLIQAQLNGKEGTLTNSAGLASALSDETGSAGGGLAVFSKSPTVETPTIASFANSAHDHADAAGGGAVVSGSTTVTGVGEVAIASEVNTGTDAARAVSPDGSNGWLNSDTWLANSNRRCLNFPLR